MSKDYNETLNLPKTDFSMRANLSQNEPLIIDFWYKKNIYQSMREKSNEKFVLHDGPPFANGKIHIGHCLNKILKDIIIKYNSVTGKGIDYIPGWDCHGLPIEHQVSKKIKDKNISKIKIRELCEEFALSFVSSQKEEFKRLGVLGDWDNPYLTISPDFEANQIDVFWNMFSKGYIYRGLKPVNWSPSSRTALAEAELDYPENHISKSIYVKLEIINYKDLFEKVSKPLFLIIWTTTPWTLPANKAVSVNKDFNYGIYEIDDTSIIIEETLSKVLEEKINKKLILITKIKGKDLIKLNYISPITGQTSPIVLADYVTKETGTGLVHTAPGHGTDDYSTGIKNNLEVYSPVDAAGRFTKEVGEDLVGLNVLKEGNEKVIDILKEKNLLILLEEYNHQYPYDWRTGKPTIFRATYQWFASVDKFKDMALDEIGKVKWYPEKVVNRISKMIEERSDWCISRQRSWGLPIPVFYYKDTNEVFINEKTIENIKEIFAKNGSSSWWELEVEDLLPEEYKKESKDLIKGQDTLDVWFDSGSSWKSVLTNHNKYPADLYLEGNDQHRGWFQSSLLTSVSINNTAPYKAVLTHGFVVDSQGQKMSKSKGNVFDPDKIIKKNGADILRLWVASEDYSSEVRISDDILSTVTDKYKKIRNTIRFLLGNLYDFDTEKKINLEKLEEIDKWILSRLGKTKENYIKYFNSYLFHIGLNDIIHFCSNDLSSIYLDIQKDVLYTYSADSKERVSCQTALSVIFKEISIMLSPVLSFTTEEAWQHYDKSELSVFEHSLSNEKFINESVESKWDNILFFRDIVLKEIEKKRKDKILGNSLEAKVSIKSPEDKLLILEENLNLLKKVFLVSELNVSKGTSSEVSVTVEKTKNKKCKRCWMFFENESFSKSDPNICTKCEEQLKV